VTGDLAADLPSVLLIGAALLAALSGVPLLLRFLSPTVGQRLATWAMLVSAAGGIAGAVMTLLLRQTVAWRLAWPFPFGPVECGIDPLTAFFALPILIVAAACCIYALDYRPAPDHPRTVRKLTFFFGLLISSMLVILMARSAGLFLLAWEIMALAAYFVLTTDDHTPEVRDAGTLYMICTHTGTLVLFALFALLKNLSGAFTFPDPGSLAATAPLSGAIFAVALFGFGFKAGLMPLHVWLPSAHANAPSHVSAVLSGVVLKMGIYGLLRTLSFFTGIPLWWGVVVLLLGMASGVGGVLFAIGQHDLKRLLAYHSIENIGIIAMGIGTALIGAATGAPTLIVLGSAGALLHVLNHAIFKSLLFLGAGSVIHATATRTIDRMGGLLRPMPWTAALFLLGAVAICGLPPLNGFASEFLIYLGFFHGAVSGSGAAAIVTTLAAPVLALIGGLAVACFVKVVGVVFLGTPRSPLPTPVHEATRTMRLSMVLLAVPCVAIGVAPATMAPLLESAAAACMPRPPGGLSLAETAPLAWISLLAATLLAVTICTMFWHRARRKKGAVATAGTWGCGYLDPGSRMQYSASSFGDTLVKLFAGILRPEVHRQEVAGPFPAGSRFSSHVPEIVLEQAYLPLLDGIYRKFLPIRKLQHGQLNIYVLYTFLTLVALFLAGSL
jgi:hydrogenase-4 component B